MKMDSTTFTVVIIALLMTTAAGFLWGFTTGFNKARPAGTIIQAQQDGESMVVLLRGCGPFGPFPLNSLRDEDGEGFACGDIFMQLRIGGNGIQ